MSADREHLSAEDLADVVRHAFAGKRTLTGIDRLRGGTKKGVYRLVLDDGTTSLVYIWNDAEDYWPAAGTPGPSDTSGLFAHASGADLFQTAHQALSAAGVRVPRVYLLDRSRSLLAGDIAVVEDIRGGSLEALMHTDPERAARVLARLGPALRAMHTEHHDRYGRPGQGTPAALPVEQLVLQRALAHLSEAARRVERIAAVEQQLGAILRERCAVLTPRTRFSLIHGELGPDHVLVDEHHFVDPPREVLERVGDGRHPPPRVGVAGAPG